MFLDPRVLLLGGHRRPSVGAATTGRIAARGDAPVGRVAAYNGGFPSQDTDGRKDANTAGFTLASLRLTGILMAGIAQAQARCPAHDQTA
ncbi:hypothetical protein OHA38_43200 (plasmid) [Streptomyces sp. NBC_01732]|uniref:hypothetical protein n=1 Tax=Streptomyces sp. NBC_01732 TaxID=2975926 RepID=UPI00352C35F4|nr:hypothetical protein OHA38_43200 [Streptomyces sp. NBC_01732]